MTRRVAVRAIIEHEGKILAVELKPYKGSVVLGTPYWCTVGGGIDDGEALMPALEREVIEETGVKPIIGSLLYVQQFAHEGKEQMEFFFNVTNPQDFMNIDLSQTTHGAIEIEKLEFIDPKISNILPQFLQTENIAAHIATKAPVKIFNYIR